jgi:hypothetical protein
MLDDDDIGHMFHHMVEEKCTRAFIKQAAYQTLRRGLAIQLIVTSPHQDFANASKNRNIAGETRKLAWKLHKGLLGMYERAYDIRCEIAGVLRLEEGQSMTKSEVPRELDVSVQHTMFGYNSDAPLFTEQLDEDTRAGKWLKSN